MGAFQNPINVFSRAFFMTSLINHLLALKFFDCKTTTETIMRFCLVEGLISRFHYRLGSGHFQRGRNLERSASLHGDL
jgi:hypothetical protein